jgi:hypothetical protein
MIVLDRVSKSCDGGGQFSLRGVSFRVPEGRLVAGGRRLGSIEVTKLSTQPHPPSKLTVGPGIFSHVLPHPFVEQ